MRRNNSRPASITVTTMPDPTMVSRILEEDAASVKQFTRAWPESWFFILEGHIIMTHDGFQIEAFEAGKNLWHARIRRSDFQPVIIDGVSFPEIEVGFAWPNAEAAIADARSRINYLNRRSEIVEPKRRAAHA